MTIIGIIRDELASNHLFRAEPDVREDSSLSELGVDDLDRVAIAMRLEEQFGIEVSDKAERSWVTVSDVIAMVSSLRRDNDGNPKGQDRDGLGREAMTACPVGVVQNNPGEPVS